MRSVFGLVLVSLLMAGALADASTYRAYRSHEEGKAAYERGDMPGALVAFQQGLSQGVYLGEFYSNLGNVYMKEKDAQRAFDAYEQALMFLEGDKKRSVLFNLGNASRIAGKTDKARAYYEQAVMMGDKDAAYNLELLLQDSQQNQEQEQEDSSQSQGGGSPPEGGNDQDESDQNQGDDGDSDSSDETSDESEDSDADESNDDDDSGGSDESDEDPNEDPEDEQDGDGKDDSQRRKEAQARAVLESFDKRESDARRRYMMRQVKDPVEVEKDW